MRRGQEFAGRLFAQHIASAGRVGQHKGRVGHAAPNLADVQGRLEVGQVLAHIALKAGLVEAVLLQHRRRFCGQRDRRQRLGLRVGRHSAFLLAHTPRSTRAQAAVASCLHFSPRVMASGELALPSSARLYTPWTIAASRKSENTT